MNTLIQHRYTKLMKSERHLWCNKTAMFYNLRIFKLFPKNHVTQNPDVMVEGNSHLSQE